MKLNFVQNTKRNIVAGSINQVFRLLFPFLNRTLFLWLLGPEYLGLNGLFTSVLGVLMLAELGFGKAVVCSMYKPVADGDHDLVCAYLSFYRTIYRWVGTIIFVGGLCLLPFLRKLVHGDIPPDVNLYVLYMLHLLNTSVSYFLFAYRGSILNVHHRNDVLTNIQTGTQIVQYIVVFAVLIITRNYYMYVIVTLLFTALSNLLLVLATQRLFPDISPSGELMPENRRQVISDVKSIFLHKIGTVITYQIDNVALSAFFGLVAVASYGNYYYVCASVAGIPAIIYSSMSGGFGNMIYTESREKNFELFMRVERLVGIIIIWCAAMMLALYQPFIALWSKNNPELMQHFLTPVLMVLFFYINQSRQVLLSFKTGAGLWHEDRWKPVVGGAVKLLTCLLFILTLPEKYNLDGLILSSIIGFVFVQIPWESHVVFSRFFSRTEERTFWFHQMQFMLIALLLCVSTWGITTLIPMNSIPGLIVKGCVATVFSSGLLLVLFRKDVPMLMDKVFNRG
jgi:O-antigen/teichoic acid export membrane protein